MRKGLHAAGDVLGGASKAITMLSSLKNPFEVVSIEKKIMASRFLHYLFDYIRLDIRMHIRDIYNSVKQAWL